MRRLSSCRVLDLSGGGGYSVQQTLQGWAANMGSKSVSWYMNDPFIKCKIWYMNGSIFQNFLKKNIFEKSGDFRKFWKNPVILPKIWPKNWYINGSILVCVGVYFQILWQHIPTKTKLEYPPPDAVQSKIQKCIPQDLHFWF